MTVFQGSSSKHKLTQSRQSSHKDSFTFISFFVFLPIQSTSFTPNLHIYVVNTQEGFLKKVYMKQSSLSFKRNSCTSILPLTSFRSLKKKRCWREKTQRPQSCYKTKKYPKPCTSFVLSCGRICYLATKLMQSCIITLRSNSNTLE